MIKENVFKFLLAVLLLTAFADAEAAFVTYDRAEFEATIDGDPLLKNKTVQGWDEIPSGTGIWFGDTIDGVTYLPLGIGFMDMFFVSAGINFTPSPKPVSLPNVLAKTSAISGFLPDVITFAFDEPVYAFGISFLAYAGEVCVIALGDDITEEPFGNLGEWGFAGIISDTSVSEVMLTIPMGNTYIFDDMIYASKVPVPGTLWLLSTGMVCLAGFRRRFKNRLF